MFCFLLICRSGMHKSWVTKFCMVVSNIFSIIITAFFPPVYKNMYRFTCTKQKALSKIEVHRSCQNCGSSVWNWIHVTFLESRIWKKLLIFGIFVDSCCRHRILWPKLGNVNKCSVTVNLLLTNNYMIRRARLLEVNLDGVCNSWRKIQASFLGLHIITENVR